MSFYGILGIYIYNFGLTLLPHPNKVCLEWLRIQQGVILLFGRQYIIPEFGWDFCILFQVRLWFHN